MKRSLLLPLLAAALLSVATDEATAFTTRPSTSSSTAADADTASLLLGLQQKPYAGEYHMPYVRVVHARVQSDAPALEEGRLVSKFNNDELETGYLNALDSVNTASVEGALMFVQAEGINQNARTAEDRCTRKNGMQYVVLFELLIAQPNETLAQFEASWSVPEYGPLLPMYSGACTSLSGSGANATFPSACLQLNGDQGQPALGPFVGAQSKSEDGRAPYPDTYWFSLPNTCPLKIWADKTDACRANTRKGLCDMGQAPDGVACTFAYDILGFVPLDDLVGITAIKDTSTGKPYTDFTTWCEASATHVEFAGDSLTGEMDSGLPFWSDPLNATRNSERAAQVVTLYGDIVSGEFKSRQIPVSELQYFKALPTATTLAASNPPCYKSVRTCNAGNGCKRSGFSQICMPCTASETCATNASFTLPTFTKASTTLTETELTAGSTKSETWCGFESCIGSDNSTTRAPTPAPTSPSTSSLSTPLIVGGVVLLVVGVLVFFFRRKLCPCFRQRDGHDAKADEVDTPSAPLTPAVDGETTASTDGVYVDMSTQDQSRTVSTTTSAVAVRSQPSESKTKPSPVPVQAVDRFPSKRLLSVRIPFNELQIGEVISHGGFGEVAFATYLNQEVAVKRLLPARRRDAKSVDSFVQEIELNATLDHACLVRFIGAAWDVRDNLCMVSEFVRGGDLRALLSEYQSNGHRHGHDGGKLRTAVQIAQALTYLHSLDPPVVHRDLKSRNVLLTELLDAKLIDFGVSTECLDETMTAGVGTSLWMAPEIMLGRRYDAKADVFSFGVILSELDTHEIPYDHVRDPDSNRKLASALLHRLIYEGNVKPRFTDLADPNIVALARDCLEVDPTMRPTAAQVLERIHSSRRQGTGRPIAPSLAVSNSVDTQNTFSFETQATTQSGRPW